MELRINSRVLDTELIFTRPGNFYVYVDLNGQPGCLGRQICEGGSLLGGTLGYHGDDEAGFKRLCRNWYRSYMRGYGNV